MVLFSDSGGFSLDARGKEIATRDVRTYQGRRVG